MQRPSRLAALALTAALVLVGCGSDTDNGGAAPSTTAAGGTTAPAGGGDFPITVTGGNGELTLDARPERIVVLAPSLTETVYAVGAGDQVVAVDDQSNFPEDAPTTALSGYEPNVEAIGDFDPDLVIASDDPGDLGKGLEAIDVAFLLLPAVDDLEGAYHQIEVVGDATGHADEADDLVADMKTTIKSLQEEVPEGEPVTYFHELDDMLYTVTSSTFIGQLYELAGFENVADGADPEGTGYPQLSPEALLDADPQAVFLADTKCCGQTPESVAKRPGWSELTAVKEGNVFPLDDDISSRWGPRIVDFLQALVDARSQIAG